jgi:hypothetical protein
MRLYHSQDKKKDMFNCNTRTGSLLPQEKVYSIYRHWYATYAMGWANHTYLQDSIYRDSSCLPIHNNAPKQRAMATAICQQYVFWCRRELHHRKGIKLRLHCEDCIIEAWYFQDRSGMHKAMQNKNLIKKFQYWNWRCKWYFPKFWGQ